MTYDRHTRFEENNFCGTINHKGQRRFVCLKQLVKKKRKNRSMSEVFQKHSKRHILSIHPSSAYEADIFHMHCIIPA